MASRNLLGITLWDTEEENRALKQLFSNMWWDIAFDNISARPTNASLMWPMLCTALTTIASM